MPGLVKQGNSIKKTGIGGPYQPSTLDLENRKAEKDFSNVKNGAINGTLSVGYLSERFAKIYNNEIQLWANYSSNDNSEKKCLFVNMHDNGSKGEISFKNGEGSTFCALYFENNRITSSTDIRFMNNSNGPILEDRSTGTLYRLYVDNGVLGIESI